MQHRRPFDLTALVLLCYYLSVAVSCCHGSKVFSDFVSSNKDRITMRKDARSTLLEKTFRDNYFSLAAVLLKTNPMHC